MHFPSPHKDCIALHSCQQWSEVLLSFLKCPRRAPEQPMDSVTNSMDAWRRQSQKHSFRALLLKVRPVGQQQRHHLRACLKCRISGFSPTYWIRRCSLARSSYTLKFEKHWSRAMLFSPLASRHVWLLKLKWITVT